MGKLLQDFNLGKNIQRLRTMSKMTQADLTAALSEMGRNMSINTLSQIENGKRNIFISDLVKLKMIFDVPFEEFFKGMY